jgi:hypothetical protein
MLTGRGFERLLIFADGSGVALSLRPTDGYRLTDALVAASGPLGPPREISDSIYFPEAAPRHPAGDKCILSLFTSKRGRLGAMLGVGDGRSDLTDLVDYPRETLDIELKKWIDLGDKVALAKLAKHIAGRKNSDSLHFWAQVRPDDPRKNVYCHSFPEFRRPFPEFHSSG